MTTPEQPVPSPTELDTSPEEKPLSAGRIMERVMLGLTVIWVLGFVVYSFVEPGPIKDALIVLFVALVWWFLFNPVGVPKKGLKK